jgi:hypothetical protein
MRNLTPHTIKIATANGEVTIAPSGSTARVAAHEEVVATVTVSGAEVLVIRRTFGAVEGLPADVGPDNPVIVSSLVLEALKASGASTAGVFAPDTGRTAIRDAAGNVVAVTRLVAA